MQVSSVNSPEISPQTSKHEQEESSNIDSSIVGISKEALASLNEAVDIFDIRKLEGYRKDKNHTRWKAISAELKKDNPQGNVTVVDYGSDRGAFSIATAKTLKHARVVSFESDVMERAAAKQKGQNRAPSAIEIHKRQLNQLGVNNNTILNRTASAKDFREFNKRKIHFTYQYCLSFFHWLNVNGTKSFEKALAAHVKNANTSFFEMISKKQYLRHNFKPRVESWFKKGETQEQAIKRALKNQGVDATVRKVCFCGHRYMFRIDLNNKLPVTAATQVAKKIQQHDKDRALNTKAVPTHVSY
ncbi:MAG: hypothetical protein GWP59_04610 [Chlamydiales bacterium]|nr:hypothetical protein [Chlamydiales bacterium]NCF70966.1 hypothetical protein [Chlamydiales bacterium]